MTPDDLKSILARAEVQFADELRKWWSFDDGQRHTHSWHDREYFIEKELPTLLCRLLEAQAVEIEKLRASSRAFLNRVEELEPQVNGAIQMAAIHGCPWPADANYIKERDVLRDALAAADENGRKG